LPLLNNIKLFYPNLEPNVIYVYILYTRAVLHEKWLVIIKLSKLDITEFNVLDFLHKPILIMKNNLSI